jgi:FMN phosphatase YigB (HAD superfamily)
LQKKSPKNSLAPKSLVIWDLDNTLTDSAGFWAIATARSVAMLRENFSVSDETLREAGERAPAQYRFSDFGRMIEWMHQELYLPQPKDAEDAYRMAITRQAIAQDWYKIQENLSVFYPDAVPTLRAIHAHGTKMTIYSDTDGPSMIRRLWLMSKNATKTGEFSRPHDLFTLFDHFYAQPACEDDSAVLRDIDLSFVLAMKRRMSIMTPDPQTGAERRKPSGEHIAQILHDFKTAPQNAMMMGDSYKDGGSAKMGGIDFVWLKFGAKIDLREVKKSKWMVSKGFKYGIAEMKKAFVEQEIPVNITLHRALPELLKKVDFIGGAKFSPCNAKTAPACHHKDACPDTQTANPTILRLAPLFHSQAQQSPMGPATHLPPTPPAQAPQDSCGKAGPEKPNSPPGPQPV